MDEMKVRSSLSRKCWVVVIAVVLAVGANHYLNTMHERRVFKDAVYYFASMMEDAHSNFSEPVVAGKKIVTGVSVLKTQNLSKFVDERDAEVIHSTLNWLYDAAWEMAVSADSFTDADREQLRDELEVVREVLAGPSLNPGFSEIRLKLSDWVAMINKRTRRP